jgi:hypothetical protein
MTPNRSPTVEQIAGRLTKAQRECFSRGTDLGCVARSFSTAETLISKGLAWREYDFQPRTLDWTPLGMQVRAHLLSETNDG